MTALNALDYIDSGLHANIINHTSTDDVTTALQSWLDDVRTNRTKGYLPSGLYNISAPLWLTINPDDTSHIEGDGGGYREALGKSIIHATQIDSPALVIQHARGVRVANILIQGDNNAPDTAANDPQDDPTLWISPGFRNTRYSPQCGVALDPATGVVPPDGGYPGMTYQGSGGGSLMVHFENVTIEHFVVGYLQSPGVTGAQGEEIRFHMCLVHHCDIAMSFGHDQNRGCVVSSSGFWAARTAVSTVAHGNQAAQFPYVSNCHFLRHYRMFESGGSQGVGKISDCYSESMKTLGIWAGNNSGTLFPFEYNNCQFSFIGDSNGKIAPWILEANAPVSCSGCMFWSSDKAALAMNFAGREQITLIDSACRGGWADNKFSLVAYNLRNGAFQPIELIRFGIHGDATQQLFIENQFQNPTGVINFRPRNIALNSGVITFDIFLYKLGTIGGMQLDGNPLKADDIVFWRILPQSGSLVQENSVPSFIVTSSIGNNVTAEAFFPDDVYDLGVEEQRTTNAIKSF